MYRRRNFTSISSNYANRAAFVASLVRLKQGSLLQHLTLRHLYLSMSIRLQDQAASPNTLLNSPRASRRRQLRPRKVANVIRVVHTACRKSRSTCGRNRDTTTGVQQCQLEFAALRWKSRIGEVRLRHGQLMQNRRQHNILCI